MNKEQPPTSVEKWSGQILRYLIENPDAKDSLQGICKWWLSPKPKETAIVNVQETLNFLAQKQWITVRETQSCQKFYGLNKDYQKEITQYLDKKTFTI